MRFGCRIFLEHDLSKMLVPVDSPRPCGPALVQCFEVVASAAAGYSTFDSWQPRLGGSYQDRDTRSRRQHSGQSIVDGETVTVDDAATATGDAVTATGDAATATASPCCSCEGCRQCCHLSPAGGAPRWAQEWAAAHSWWDAKLGAFHQGCCNRSLSKRGCQLASERVAALLAEDTGIRRDAG